MSSRRTAVLLKMKRTRAPTTPKPNKRLRGDIQPYHLSPSKLDGNGDRIWPAPNDKIERARKIIVECATSNQKVVLVPDKDADGLSSGAILRATLLKLGLMPEKLSVHFVEKGTSIAHATEQRLINSLEPAYVFVLDQGSVKCPPLVDKAHTALVIDHHHYADGEFPAGAEFVSAAHCPPVATSSLLTYIICSDLHPGLGEETQWLCALGTHGDLGNTLKWEPPFPDMNETFKKHSKQKINSAVSLINAPRRTAAYDVESAWTALINAKAPDDILKNARLLEARDEVNREVERCTHTAPRFSADGSIAFFRISSSAQVHPVIATRWAGHLKSQKLHVVMVANDGYLPGKVNFSCRIARCARERGDEVNIIEILRSLLHKSEHDDLAERLGTAFARGHKEASGGIVDADAFEEFVKCMQLVDRKRAETKQKAVQANTLGNYFSTLSSSK
jgi:single-stranded DNA-specific DHH superfamily exonuclease